MIVNKLTIQGVDYTSDIKGLDELKINIKPNQANTFNVALSDDIVAKSDAFRFLQSYYSDKSNRDTELEAKLTIDDGCNCEVTLDLKITSDGIEICPLDKTIRTPLKVDTSIAPNIERLRSRILWHNSNDEADVTEFTTNVIPLHFQSEDNDFLVTERYINAPYVLEAIEYNCNLCGITFVSSILQQAPYNALVLIPIQFEKATTDVLDFNYPIQNLPNLTTTQLLELLAPLFNAEFRFVDGRLLFERIDYFKNPSSVLFNADTEYQADRATVPCFTFNTENAVKVYNLEYSSDPIETDANDVLYIWNETVYWDTTSKFLKGTRNIISRFSPIDFDNNKLGLEKHKSANYKLLIHDTSSSRVSATADEYNTIDRLSFRKDAISGLPYTFVNSLFNKFYSIDDPNGSAFEYYEVDEITWKPDNFCEVLPNLVKEDFIPGIDFDDYGTGIPEEWEIDLYKRTIKFKKIKVK